MLGYLVWEDFCLIEFVSVRAGWIIWAVQNMFLFVGACPPGICFHACTHTRSCLCTVYRVTDFVEARFGAVIR
jgi:hypothetical protein